MIGFFPDPYPDELLYSAYCRYHQRVQHPSQAATARDLLGHRQAQAVVDLPSRLDYLTAVLPPGHGYTVDRFIDDHTLLPFYSPFLPPERVDRLREDMRGNEGARVHARMGLFPAPIRLEVLRFCPRCVTVDRQQWGETYWHRLHQVPGAEVCPLHGVFLEKSGVPMRYRNSQEAFVAAEQGVRPVLLRVLDPANRRHNVLLDLAHDAVWLLGQPHFVTGPKTLFRRYRHLLFNHGLATASGTVHNQALREAFRKHYPPDLLPWLPCALESRCPWLIRLVQTSRGVQPPVHHLLLMRFLDCPAEKFFQLPEPSEPFGDLSRRSVENTESTNPTPPRSGQKRVVAIPPKQLKAYRSQWLQAVAEDPQAGRYALSKKISRVFGWLYRHDRLWLQAHLPPRRKGGGPPRHINWVARDTELAAAVQASAARLRSAQGRPVRVTVRAMAKDVGHMTMINQQQHQLPLTIKTLVAHAETREALAVRRIQWAANSFRQENQRPTRWLVRQRAAINHQIAALPLVQRALADAVQSFDGQNTQAMRS